MAPSWEAPASPPAAAPAASGWGAPSAAPSWDIPKTEEPAAPPAPSWSAPAAPAPEPFKAPAPSAPAPAAPPSPPWNAPAAPAWSAPAAPAASTDADLAAGARAAAAAPAPVVPDVAATMVAPPPTDSHGAEREGPTTLMPAWSPPPTAPPPMPATMAMPAKTAPPAGVAAGPQGELTIESGPDAGHAHRAGDHALRLGRSPDNDVILRDPATSGHHARLERRGEEFWLIDLGSTNGTFVNGEAIQEKQLNTGDRLTIGQNSIHFAVLGA